MLRRGKTPQRFSRVDALALSGPVYSRMPGQERRKVKTPDPTMRRRVFDRDAGQCQYCGVLVAFNRAHIDHVHPWYHGGETELRNLVTSCRDCNMRKSTQRIPGGLKPSTALAPRPLTMRTVRRKRPQPPETISLAQAAYRGRRRRH